MRNRIVGILVLITFLTLNLKDITYAFNNKLELMSIFGSSASQEIIRAKVNELETKKLNEGFELEFYAACRALVDIYKKHIGVGILEEIVENQEKEKIERIKESIKESIREGRRLDRRSYINEQLIIEDEELMDEIKGFVKRERLETKLLEIVLKTRGGAGEDYRLAGVNAITILNKTGYDFRGLDLSGIRIGGIKEGAGNIGANLEGSNMVGVNFSGSDLRGVNFKGTDLRYANLSYSEVRGVKFTKSTRVKGTIFNKMKGLDKSYRKFIGREGGYNEEAIGSLINSNNMFRNLGLIIGYLIYAGKELGGIELNSEQEEKFKKILKKYGVKVGIGNRYKRVKDWFKEVMVLREKERLVYLSEVMREIAVEIIKDKVRQEKGTVKKKGFFGRSHNSIRDLVLKYYPKKEVEDIEKYYSEKMSEQIKGIYKEVGSELEVQVISSWLGLKYRYVKKKSYFNLFRTKPKEEILMNRDSKGQMEVLIPENIFRYVELIKSLKNKKEEVVEKIEGSRYKNRELETESFKFYINSLTSKSNITKIAKDQKARLDLRSFEDEIKNLEEKIRTVAASFEEYSEYLSRNEGEISDDIRGSERFEDLKKILMPVIKANPILNQEIDEKNYKERLKQIVRSYIKSKRGKRLEYGEAPKEYIGNSLGEEILEELSSKIWELEVREEIEDFKSKFDLEEGFKKTIKRLLKKINKKESEIHESDDTRNIYKTEEITEFKKLRKLIKRSLEERSLNMRILKEELNKYTTNKINEEIAEIVLRIYGLNLILEKDIDKFVGDINNKRGDWLKYIIKKEEIRDLIADTEKLREERLNKYLFEKELLGETVRWLKQNRNVEMLFKILEETEKKEEVEKEIKWMSGESRQEKAESVIKYLEEILKKIEKQNLEVNNEPYVINYKGMRMCLMLGRFMSMFDDRDDFEGEELELWDLVLLMKNYIYHENNKLENEKDEELIASIGKIQKEFRRRIKRIYLERKEERKKKKEESEEGEDGREEICKINRGYVLRGLVEDLKNVYKVEGIGRRDRIKINGIPVRKKLDEGGYGAVYEWNKSYAVKVLKEKGLERVDYRYDLMEKISKNDSSLKDMLREYFISLLSRYKKGKRERVRTVFNYRDIIIHSKGTEIRCYAIMDKYERLKINNKLELYRLFIDMLIGLRYMRARGTTHRDLKPPNVMYNVNEKKNVIGDFGGSGDSNIYIHTVDTGKEKRVTTSSNIMAPEALGGEITPKYDIWSLGSFIWIMVSKIIKDRPDYGIVYSLYNKKVVRLRKETVRYYYDKLYKRHIEELKRKQTDEEYIKYMKEAIEETEEYKNKLLPAWFYQDKELLEILIKMMRLNPEARPELEEIMLELGTEAIVEAIVSKNLDRLKEEDQKYIEEFGPEEEKRLKKEAKKLKEKSLGHAIETLREKQYENLDADIKEKLKFYYVPLEVTEELGDEESEDLVKEVDKYLNSQDKQTSCMLLLGDAGSGKTLTSHYLKNRLWQAQNNQDYIPIYIALSKLDNPKKCIKEALKEYGFSRRTIEELKEKKVLFILDGYDEIYYKGNIYKDNDFIGWPNAKVIITCRTQYITTKEDFKSKFTESIKGPKIRYIKGFNKAQIKEYLKKYKEKKDKGWEVEKYYEWVEEYYKKLEEVEGLIELIENPFMLSLVIEVFEDIKNKDKIGKNDIYKEFVEKWYARELGKVESLKIKTFKNFSIELACMMYKKGKVEIAYDPLRYKYNRAKREIVEQLAEKSGGPLIKRTKDETYTFMHKSYMEYFVSKEIIKEIEVIREKLEDLEDEEKGEKIKKWLLKNKSILTKRLITKELDVINFVVEQINGLKIKDREIYKEVLLEIVKATREIEYKERYKGKDKKIVTAGINAMTLLNYCNYTFSGKDLKGVKIGGIWDKESEKYEGLDGEGIIMDSTDLSESDLRGANLKKAWLRNTDIRKSHVQDIDFGERAYLEGHTASVESVAFSPDYKTLASGSKDGTVQLWDTKTWKHERTLGPFKSEVHSLSYSPDGQILAIGTRDDTVYLWDISKNKVIETFEGGREIKYRPDGKKIAGLSGIVEIWDKESRKICKEIKSQSLSSYGYLLEYSPTSDRLVIRHHRYVCDIHIIDTNTYEKVFSISSRIYDRRVPSLTAVAYDPSLDGNTIACGDGKSNISLWDAKTGELKARLRIDYGSKKILNIAYNPADKTTLAAACEDKKIYIIDTKNMKIKNILIGHEKKITSLAYNEDGSILVSGSEDTRIRLWSTKIDKPRRYNIRNIDTIEYSPNGETLAIVRKTKRETNNYIELIDIETGELKKILRGHKDSISRFEYSPDGTVLASKDKSELRIWSTKTYDFRFTLTDVSYRNLFSSDSKKMIIRKKGIIEDRHPQTGELVRSSEFNDRSIKYSLNSKLLISSNESGWDVAIRIWDRKNYELKSTLRAPENTHFNEYHTFDNNTLAIVFIDPKDKASFTSKNKGNIWLIDIETGKYKKTFKTFGSRLRCNPNSETMIIDRWDIKGLELWDKKTETYITTLVKEGGWNYKYEYTPNGKTIVLAKDGEVRILDSTDGKEKARFNIGVKSKIEKIVFNINDNNKMAIYHEDKTLQVWDIGYKMPRLLKRMDPELFLEGIKIGNPERFSYENINLLRQRGAITEIDFLLSKGDTYFDNGDYQEALKAYEKANLESDNIKDWENIADKIYKIYEKETENKKVLLNKIIKIQNSILKQDNRLSKIWIDKAKMIYELSLLEENIDTRKDYLKESLGLVRKAISIDAGVEEGVEWEEKILKALIVIEKDEKVKQNLYNEMLDYYNREIELHSDKANLYKSRGDIYRFLGKSEESKSDYKEAMTKACERSSKYADTAKSLISDPKIDISIFDGEWHKYLVFTVWNKALFKILLEKINSIGDIEYILNCQYNPEYERPLGLYKYPARTGTLLYIISKVRGAFYRFGKETIEELTKLGADIELADYDGFQPVLLLIACSMGGFGRLDRSMQDIIEKAYYKKFKEKNARLRIAAQKDFLYAWKSYEIGNYKDSIMYLTKAIEKDPTKLWFYIWRGYANTYLGSYEDVKRDFKEAKSMIDRTKANAQETNKRWIIENLEGPYRRLVEGEVILEVALSTNDFSRALKVCEQALEKFPENVLLKIYLGKIMFLNGASEEKVIKYFKELNESLKSNKVFRHYESHPYHIDFAMIYCKLGRYQEALEHCKFAKNRYDAIQRIPQSLEGLLDPAISISEYFKTRPSVTLRTRHLCSKIKSFIYKRLGEEEKAKKEAESFYMCSGNPNDPCEICDLNNAAIFLKGEVYKDVGLDLEHKSKYMPPFNMVMRYFDYTFKPSYRRKDWAINLKDWHLKKVQELFLRITELEPVDKKAKDDIFKSYSQLARINYDEDNRDKTVLYYKKAVEFSEKEKYEMSDDWKYEIYRRLARMYIGLDETKQAEEYFKKCLKNKETKSAVFSEYAMFLYKQKDYSKVIDMCLECIKGKRDGSLLKYRKIDRETLLKELKKELDEATAKGKLMELSPYLLAYRLLISSYMKLNQKEKAEQALIEFEEHVDKESSHIGRILLDTVLKENKDLISWQSILNHDLRERENLKELRKDIERIKSLINKKIFKKLRSKITEERLLQFNVIKENIKDGIKHIEFPDGLVLGYVHKEGKVVDVKVIEESVLDQEIIKAINEDKILIAQLKIEDMIDNSIEYMKHIFIPIHKDLGFNKFREVICEHKKSIIDFQLKPQKNITLAM